MPRSISPFEAAIPNLNRRLKPICESSIGRFCGPRGGKSELAGKLTAFAGPIHESLSFKMWGPTAPTTRELRQSDVGRWHDAGSLVDLTRLVCETGWDTPQNSLAVIGACVAATEGTKGSFFTVTSHFARLLRLSGIHFETVHSGTLGSEPCALLVVPRSAWHSIAGLRPRQMLTRGALAFDPAVAQSLPFFESVRRRAVEVDLRDDPVLDLSEQLASPKRR